jgi:hypothetical protein
MKHLKSYKIFESSESQSEEIKSYLSQIFLELEDNGYDIDIEGRWMRTYNTEELTGFQISISGKEIEEDILPTIQTAINYISDEGFVRCWLSLDNVRQLEFDEFVSYLDIKKQLANPPGNNTVNLNFRK